MNNKAPILQVLMSLFSDLPYFDGDMVKLTNSQEILHELQKAGLSTQAIEQAIAWLERFSKFNDEPRADYHPETVRVFTSQEKAIIPTESYAFCLKLTWQVIFNRMSLNLLLNKSYPLAHTPLLKSNSYGYLR